MATRHKTLEYLATTKIGEKGQLTVPKSFREELGLGAGSPFAVLRLGDGLVLLPEEQRFEQLCEQIGSALTHAGVRTEALLETLPEARKRVYVSRYGNRTRSRTSPRRTRSPLGK
jgi:AbrB family looped-hinge helix DNA binding protein